MKSRYLLAMLINLLTLTLAWADEGFILARYPASWTEPMQQEMSDYFGREFFLNTVSVGGSRYLEIPGTAPFSRIVAEGADPLGNYHSPYAMRQDWGPRAYELFPGQRAPQATSYWAYDGQVYAPEQQENGHLVWAKTQHETYVKKTVTGGYLNKTPGVRHYVDQEAYLGVHRYQEHAFSIVEVQESTNWRTGGDGATPFRPKDCDLDCVPGRRYIPKVPPRTAIVQVPDLQPPPKVPGVMPQQPKINCKPTTSSSAATKALLPLAAAFSVHEGVHGYKNGVNNQFERATGLEQNLNAMAIDLLNPVGSFFRDLGRESSGNTEVVENGIEDYQSPFLLKTSYHINMREEIAKMAAEDQHLRTRLQEIKAAFERHTIQVGNLPIYLPRLPKW